MGEHSSPKVGVPVDGGAQQGTTTFSSASTAVPYDRHSSIIDPQNDVDVEANDINTIPDFLAKPVQVASGTFSAANTWNAQLFGASIFSLFDAQTIWKNKYQGYLNVRGDVKFRLVVNPTPFQAGLLRLSYYPSADKMPMSVAAHRLDRVTKSQAPGTYLDLADNFCEVTVPYVTPTTFMQRDRVGTSDHCDWGSVYIDVFEIYRTGTGPAQINWTLWMSVESFETSGMIQPQAGDAKRRGRTIDSEANDGRGPVAKIMSSGVTLANNLSTIPTLAPIARPASWVLDALRGCAEALGWSKPTIGTGPSPVTRNVHTYNINSDGNDNCLPLSIRTDNKISAITDASPGDLDEMSFNFIKSRWSYLQDFGWSSSSVTGDLLASVFVCPATFRTTQTIGGNTVITTPPCAAMSEMYETYRGSFQVKMRLVKTGFHTGTLAFTWTPGQQASTPSYSNTSYMYRQIIDLQEGNNFIFDLPCLVAQDFLPVNSPTGIFTVHVVNPLLAPATVASTIDVMFEVRGGEDLQYAVPKSVSAVPFVPQGGDSVDATGDATALAMSSQTHGRAGVHHAMIAIGEIQLSVNDILKTHYNLRFATATGPSQGSGNPFSVAAGQTYAARYNGVTTTVPELGGDLYSFISSWFAFHRGSERFRVMCRDNGTTNVNYRATLVTPVEQVGASPFIWWQGAPATFSWSQTLANITGMFPRSHRFTQIPQDNGGLALQVPYYNQYRYSVNELVTAPGARSAAFSNRIAFGCNVPNSIGAVLTRAVGDDFQFSYFIGIPAYAAQVDAWWPAV
jgi:hypothetical protein